MSPTRAGSADLVLLTSAAFLSRRGLGRREKGITPLERPQD